MPALIFYISYPFLYLLSISPFWLLYRLSDGLYFMLYFVVKYRKKTVFQNLQKSFPEKSALDIVKIAREYYRYLSDLILESIKTLSITEKEVRKHTTMHNANILNDYYDNKRSVIIVMGHYGNWELALSCFSLNCKPTMCVVYKPLKNKYFDKVFLKARIRFGAEAIPMKSTIRAIIENKNRITAIGLAADQTPTNMNGALWMNFLNQDTPVFNGPEKISRRFGYPVVYLDIKRPRRGFYELTPIILYDDPKKTEDNEITLHSNQVLEAAIIKQPNIWLWSHRRWKRKREGDYH